MTFTREDTECVLFAPDVTASESEFKRLAHDVERFVKFEEGISGHIIFQGHEGSVTYKVDVPGEIVRVQAAAKIGCRRGGTKNSVLFSVDGGKTWILACRQRIVQDEDHNEEQWTQCIEGILDFERKKAYSPACTPGGGSVRESDFEPKATKSVLVKFDTRGGNGKLVQVPGIYVLYRKQVGRRRSRREDWRR